MDQTRDRGHGPKHTALYPFYSDYGAKLVEFAGYEMPASYRLGVLQEHLWTRRNAGLFDISHMGQAWLVDGEKKSFERVAVALEELVPAELRSLVPGGQQYTQLLNSRGGTIDDLIVTKPLAEEGEGKYGDRMYMVVNASRKEKDYQTIQEQLQGRVELERLESRALLALQGPLALGCLERLIPGISGMVFMTWRPVCWNGLELLVSRSGYTGEDGFEVSLPGDAAVDFARSLLAMDEVEPIGLGARDSLRLEAGLCLYGNDLDEETSPVEAGLLWSIGKRRRAEGGFPGWERIHSQLQNGPQKKRVGLDIAGRTPCRAGTEIFVVSQQVGVVSSGGFSPCLEKPIAMGYVASSCAKAGTELLLRVRGKEIEAKVCKLPFVQANYAR